MFLYIIGERAFNCTMQEKFQYLDNTISYIFYKVFSFLLYLHAKTINLPIKDDILYFQITNNSKCFPYF